MRTGSYFYSYHEYTQWISHALAIRVVDPREILDNDACRMMMRSTYV